MNTEWKLVRVNEAFSDLMFWLERCEQKGHLENCYDLVDPWAAFEYEYVDAAPPAPTSHPIPTGATGEKDEQEFDAKLGAYIREWLRRHGWHPEEGEGEWEFAQRICYEAGRRDAAPYWARTYEDQDNYDQAVADAIKRVSARIERAGRPAAGDALAYGSPADVAQRIEQYLHHDGRKNSATQLLYEAMKALRGPKLKGEA